jgi:hypothetical protein
MILVKSMVNPGDIGYLYLSPTPYAEYSSPQTRYVLVRFQDVSPVAITNLADCITVTGALSGPHVGQTKIASDGRTMIFTMTTDFQRNEAVTVSLNPGVASGAGGTLQPFQYQFMVSGHLPDGAQSGLAGLPSPAGSGAPTAAPGTKPAPPSKAAAPTPPPIIRAQGLTASKGVVGIMPNGVSVPSDFPWITITVNNNPDPNPIFIDNRGGGGKPYNVIFDNQGRPIWYMRMPDERRDMKVQPNGVLTMLARDNGLYFYGLNTNYQKIGEYRAVNGYSTDEHELQVLADGTYFLIGLRSETVDMTRYLQGANPAASVGETVIQQFTPAGELIFQWRAWDHYDVRDLRLDNPRAASFRFPHMNAIDVDTDGHLLVSCRHLSEVTKINRDTGDIIWRLAGAHSSFTFTNDPLNGFENQHAIRAVGTNRYTLFDNGDLHNPPVSRGVEYVLDTNTWTARIVWQYPDPATTAYYAHYMGNAQRLSNGNTLIDWAIGALPKLTEVRPDGTKAFEMNWTDGWEAYRTWRCPWQGSAVQPYLIVEAYPDKVTLLFNQFGNTNVAFYRIYGGTTPQPTNLLATSTATMARLSNLQNSTRYFFRVTAVDRQDAEGGYSNEETVVVNLVKPGQNLVLNGDFEQGQVSWIWTNVAPATAAWAITNGAAFIDLTNAGTALSHVQLRQPGMKLLQGRTYVLEFDAWAPQPRVMEARVGQDQSPFTGYKVASVSLTPVTNHFRYPFAMTQATDLNGRVVFNVGVTPVDVYLDNVALWMVAPGDFDQDKTVGLEDLKVLTDQWLQTGSGLSADLNGDERVDFGDLAVLGENWSGP